MNLSRAELVEAVRMMVKQHDLYAQRAWAAVRDNPLLAAKVRGALSAVRADVRGTRDEVMWLMWINEARQALEPTTAGAAEQVDAAPAEPSSTGAQDDGIVEINLEIPAVRKDHQVSSAPSVVFQQPGR